MPLPTLPGGSGSDAGPPARGHPAHAQEAGPAAESALDGRIDRLTAAARAVLRLGGSEGYGRLVPEGPGSDEARAALTGLGDIVDSAPADRREADCLRAALWLWHDFLDEAHGIVQNVASATGSYWHAVMHRHEGDFSNSKFWYDRAAGHPAYATLAIRAEDLLRNLPADKVVFKITARGWNPAALVDLVEAVHDRPADPRHSLAVALQRLEWRTMFDMGVRAATG